MEMDQLVALCKRRGFLFQSSEIYGGLQGFWDYGPLGVELKRNVREAWWRDMVTAPQRAGSSARRPLGLRNGRPRLLDHHAPAGLEVFGPLRSVPRLHGRLPRVEEALPLRPGLRPLGDVQGATDLRGQRRRRQRGPGTDAAQGDEVLQPPRQRRRRTGLGRPAGLADDRDATFARARAPTPRRSAR